MSFKPIPALLCAVSIYSCSGDNFGDGYDHPRCLTGLCNSKEARHRTGSSEDSLLLVCGVEYPEDYNWVKDSGADTVDCRICIWENGKRKLSLSAEGNPDRHLLANGHLYMDICRNGRTVLMRDGEEAAAWEGEEYVAGIVENNGLWTLSQDVDGTGISLRKDGALYFTDAAGIIAGDIFSTAWNGGIMYMDDARMCFAYSRKSQLDGTLSWFLVADGVPTEVKTGLEKVHDIRMHKRRMYACGLLKSTDSAPSINIGGEIRTMDAVSGLSVRTSAIRFHGSEIMLEGEMRAKDGSLSRLLWDRNSRPIRVDGGSSGFFVDDEVLGWYTADASGRITGLSADNVVYKLDGSRRMYSGRCIHIHNGKVSLALSPPFGAVDSRGAKLHPVLWKDGKTEELAFNGYLTGIEVCISDR